MFYSVWPYVVACLVLNNQEFMFVQFVMFQDNNALYSLVAYIQVTIFHVHVSGFRICYVNHFTLVLSCTVIEVQKNVKVRNSGKIMCVVEGEDYRNTTHQGDFPLQILDHSNTPLKSK